MEKKVQLDIDKIQKTLNSIKRTYPIYMKIGNVPAFLFVISIFWILIDFLNWIDGGIFSPWSIIMLICSSIILSLLKKVTLSMQRKYEMTFKRLMAEPILRASFVNVKYSPEMGFSKSEVKRMELLYISMDEHFESEDMIEAEYMGVTFKQSDILLSHYTQDDNNRRYIVPQDYEGRDIQVDGRLTRFPYKTNIKGVVQIATRKGIKWKHYLGRKRFEVEDVEFNNHYDVFADDEHSVFYALTPQMIDCFNSLHVVSKEQISATMDGEYLYILRYGKGGVFKADIREEFKADAKEKQIYTEIAEIQKLIKVLHLHKRVKLNDR